MTKTEYTIAITANQTAISNVRADLRKLRNIEKLAKSFPEPQKLVDFDMLDASSRSFAPSWARPAGS